jgi:DNA-binding NtrC family response regulator
VRIVSSTHRDLTAAMASGAFREDLYFSPERAAHPPAAASRPRRRRTRARRDVPREFARDLGKTPPRLDPDAAAWLLRYAWPGNVREIRNVMERAAVLCHGNVVDAAFARALIPAVGDPPPASHDLEHALAELERRMILDALAATGDNKVAAAKRLGIGERTLWTKLKKHGI